MNVHELPLILFTVLAQMSVGAFVALGVVQVVGRVRFGKAAVDELADPALYAIGPVLVLGLLASMLHLGNPFNALNTFRHLDSSWLSREIVFGIAFAGLGFLFAALQFLRWGSTALRQALAALTAVVGLGLVWVMAMVYASLPTVPAWNTWATPAQFFLTTFLLGALAVGAALMGVTMWRRQRLGERFGWVTRLAPVRRLVALRRDGEPAPDAVDGDQLAAVRSDTDTHAVARRELVETSLRWVATASILLLGVQLVVIVLMQRDLAADPGMPTASIAAYGTGWFVARLVLLVLGAGLLGLTLYRLVVSHRSALLVASVATTALVTVLASELIGRSLFYDSMVRIGM